MLTYRVSKPTSFPACDQGSRRRSLQLGTFAAVIIWGSGGRCAQVHLLPRFSHFQNETHLFFQDFRLVLRLCKDKLLPQRRIKGDELPGQFSALTVINPVFQMANDKQRVIAFFASLLNISGACASAAVARSPARVSKRPISKPKPLAPSVAVLDQRVQLDSCRLD